VLFRQTKQPFKKEETMVTKILAAVSVVLLMWAVACSSGESEHQPTATTVDIEATVDAGVATAIASQLAATIKPSPTSTKVPASTATPAEAKMVASIPTIQLVNYSSFSTDDIEKWIDLTESRMASRKSRIFVFIYPLGKVKEPEKRIVGTDYASGVYREQTVLLSQDEIETILSQIEAWLQEDSCVHKERKALALSDYRIWLEQGADSSFQQALCETTRVVMMAIHPQIRDHEPIEYFHYFLVHELYHALSQDLDDRGECSRKRNDAGINSNSVWMYEGGAHYFGTWLVAEEYGKPNYRSQILESAKQAFERNGNNKHLGEGNPAPDRAGAAALSLMIEHGMVTEGAILDGSLFHNCDRELKFDHTSPDIQHIHNSWYLIEQDSGVFQFTEEALIAN